MLGNRFEAKRFKLFENRSGKSCQRNARDARRLRTKQGTWSGNNQRVSCSNRAGGIHEFLVEELRCLLHGDSLNPSPSVKNSPDRSRAKSCTWLASERSIC